MLCMCIHTYAYIRISSAATQITIPIVGLISICILSLLLEGRYVIKPYMYLVFSNKSFTMWHFLITCVMPCFGFYIFAECIINSLLLANGRVWRVVNNSYSFTEIVKWYQLLGVTRFYKLSSITYCYQYNVTGCY